MLSKTYLIMRRREAPSRRTQSRAATIARFRGVRSAERFQFVDEAGDHAEALRPEGRVGGVEPARRQQLAVAQGAAGAQQLQVALGKTAMRVLIGRVKRVHQAIAKGIGVDVER